ncbi:hypothetical protein LDENG_00090750 [Lucifuga dentata]|nr:hypothetical protein LDENG_00090750 [Lucifuga dentata]
MLDLGKLCLASHEATSIYRSLIQYVKGPYLCFACLSLIYSIFIHITLLTIILQRILLEW